MESSFQKLRRGLWSSFIPWVIKAALFIFLFGTFIYVGMQYEQMFDGSTF